MASAISASGSTGVRPSAEAIEALYVCENCGPLAAGARASLVELRRQLDLRFGDDRPT